MDKTFPKQETLLQKPGHCSRFAFIRAEFLDAPLDPRDYDLEDDEVFGSDDYDEEDVL